MPFIDKYVPIHQVPFCLAPHPHSHSTNAKTAAAAPTIDIAAPILLAPPVTCDGAGVVVLPLPGAPGLEVG